MRGEERCPLKDDRDLLIEKMMTSDGVVFASPNYSFQVSAIMKTFLDRLGFVFHRPRFHGKTFTSIVVQGFYGGGKIVKYLEFVGAGLGFNVVKGSCITALEPMAEKDRRRMDKALRKAEQAVSRAALQAGLRCTIDSSSSWRSGWAARASSRRSPTTTATTTYYRDRGWFDSDYFYPTRARSVQEGHRSDLRLDVCAHLQARCSASKEPRIVTEESSSWAPGCRASLRPGPRQDA